MVHLKEETNLGFIDIECDHVCSASKDAKHKPNGHVRPTSLFTMENNGKVAFCVKEPLLALTESESDFLLCKNA